MALLAAPTFIYPLNHPPQVTSSFGTYRIGHHHAGLDLTTDGSEAVEVRAAAAGEIFRVRRNDAGYGRAIYIRHPDGRQTVYAHLSAFGPRLAAEIKAREAREKQFFLAFNLKPMAVTQGEVLGYVGTSGTDLVHLHFEVRVDGQPVNPLTNGLVIPDTQAPQIRTILAVPRTPDAHVDQAHDEKAFEVPADGRLAKPIQVGGDVVLYVEAPDHIDGSARDLTAYQLDLLIDGAVWHTTRYDQVSYADERLPELDFHLEREARKTGRFNALFSWGPRMGVHPKPGKSLAKLVKGSHPAVIRVRDAAGNQSEARFTLEVGPTVPPCVPTALKAGKRKDIAPPADRLWRGRLLVVPVPGLCGDTPQVEVHVNGKAAKGWRVSRLGGQPALALQVPAEEDALVEVAVANGGAADRFRIQSHAMKAGAAFEEGEARIEVGGKDALFFPYPTEITKETNPGGPGLEIVGPLVRMSNRFVPALAAARLGLLRPGGVGHVGVYIHDNGRWWYIGGKDEPRYTFGGSVHTADAALMRDLAGPVIGEPEVTPHPAGPRLIIPVKDEGAGVSTVDVTLDGKAIYTERQKPFDRVVWLPLSPVKPGPHRLTIKARDRSGRETTVERSVTWP